MERLSLRQRDALRALKTLDDILKERFSIIVRDTTIQRFEYTFEALWKFLREYLKDKEGIVCNSPKSCFRGISSLGLLTEEETVKCLEMTDSRNDTSRTYKEMVGEIIYRKVKKEYLSLMKNLMHKLEPGAELNQPNKRTK